MAIIQGVVSESLAVNTEYLPRTIKINSPRAVRESEEVEVSCLLSNSFPLPEVTWTMEKIGGKDDIIEKRADVSGGEEDAESLLVTEEFSLEAGAGLTEVSIIIMTIYQLRF